MVCAYIYPLYTNLRMENTLTAFKMKSQMNQKTCDLVLQSWIPINRTTAI